MQLFKGASSWAQLKKSETSASNAGVVTLTAGGAVIIDAPDVTGAVGDQVFVSAVTNATKGASSGKTSLSIENVSGNGSVEFGDSQASASLDMPFHGSGSSWFASGSFLFRVTAAGTLTFRLAGSSAGSDSSVGIGSGQIRVIVLRGS
jgi:hypothetical protein